MAFIEYGYKADGKALPLEYLVKVTSVRNQATVVSPLQDDIMLGVRSFWSPFLPTSLLRTGNIAVQAATGGRRALVTKATSRRIWTGSSPMRLKLKMRFEAVENSLKEVVEPIRLLCAMALPSEPSSGEENVPSEAKGLLAGITTELSKTAENVATVGGLVPLLRPPGPSPFALQGVLDLRAGSSMLPSAVIEGLSIFDAIRGGDKIMIELGNFVTFYNVIITEVNNHVPIKFDPNGNPISATISVNFETYEMMTTQDLFNSFRKRTST